MTREQAADLVAALEEFVVDVIRDEASEDVRDALVRRDSREVLADVITALTVRRP